MKGAQLVVEAIRREGIDTIFGYPGGAIMPVYDALVGSGIRHILVRHEQAAVHAAEAYARVSGKPGVVLATSGPGATNLVTGLADALLDSVPVVAITGQVASHLMGTDAFQEVDSFGTMLPVVKHNFLVKHPAKLDESLRLAFRLSRTGRQGPVALDLPKDVQLAECPTAELPEETAEVPCLDGLEEAAAMLRASKRPLVYAGGGIYQAGAVAEFRALARRLEAPVVCTLKGLGALPTDDPLLLGMMGMHGTARANRALRDCDLLFVVGARFDDRATGKLDTFCPNAKVLHFDVDPAEVGKLRQPDVSVVGTLKDTLPPLTSLLVPGEIWPPEAPDPEPVWELESPCPRDVLRALQADVVTTDVGQHQMWSAQFLKFHDGMHFLTSGGLGTMGFGLPAAVGAQLAKPDAQVVCVSGDGSFMMNVQELATVARYRLPVKIVLFDNRCLGMVRQWQELFFENRESEIDLSDNPDFVELARVFGIPGRRVTRNDEVAGAVDEALSAKGPFLLHCLIEREANVWPIVPTGKANHEMLEEKPCYTK